MNQLVINACIVEVGVLRFTPAHLPAFDLRLEHESQLEEAGQLRSVKAKLKAVAFGAMAERLKGQPIGSTWRFVGFLATPTRGVASVLHIQDFTAADD
ncbi:primosomal replication protein N [Aeromicrobium sp.]|uniref:primosomal replication protein N n=1 Tax=Aeromicrobium sp. TaxID=1871063 RepID=UPI003C4E82D0